MEQPVLIPMAMAMNNMVTGAQVPTADRASSPAAAKLPTTMPSTALYSCCKKFPAISGRVKSRRSFHSLPSVINFVRATRPQSLLFRSLYPTQYDTVYHLPPGK